MQADREHAGDRHRPATPTRSGPARRAEGPLPTHPAAMTPAGMIALQQAAGNRIAGMALQRAGAAAPAPSQDARDDASDVSTASAEVREARHSLSRSITGRSEAQRIGKRHIRKALLRRLKSGPPFSDQEIAHIKTVAPRSMVWLQDIGIGTYEDAEKYHAKQKYYDWLKLEPGKRILIATLAWNSERLRHGQERSVADTPTNPAYTLGRTLALHSGAVTGEEAARHTAERDRRIHEAFVNTQDEAAFPVPASATVEDVRKADRARDVLTRVFLILQNGLKVYQVSDLRHIDYRDNDIARALAHGGRVNIRIPQLGQGESAGALTDWLGLTQDGADTDRKERRTFSSHRMNIQDNKGGVPGRFEEQGEFPASAKNFLGQGIGENRPMYGVDLAADGMGNTDFNRDVILPNGAHGHMLLAFTPPQRGRDGALQVGIETIAPGNTASPVGYEHNLFSSEKTANPESSFYGHKQDKIGEGSLARNQRLVDLNEFKTAGGGDWKQFLQDLDEKWNSLLAATSNDHAQRRALYARLTGPRSGEFRPDSAA